jgi:TDG/mug DNA glycosylase family protein
VAILGVGAYRSAFNRPKVIVGPQSEMLVFSTVWVLPNPSGLNANYQIRDLTVLFRRLRRASVARAVKSGTEHEELEKSRKNGDRWKLQKHAY